MVHKLTSAPILRLAHLVWFVLFLFLCWHVALSLSNIQAILAFERNEWSVQESLKALPGISAAGYVLYLTVIRLATAVLYWLTAVLIFWRKRDGWYALAVSSVLLFFPFSFVFYLANTALQTLGMLALLAVLLLPFFFPDGRLIPQSTRWRISLIVYLLLVPFLAFNLLPLVYPRFQQDEVGWVGLILSLTAILAAGMISQIARYRQMAKPERLQTKWVLIGGFGSLTLLFFWIGVWALAEISDPAAVLFTLHLLILSAAAFPLAIGYSILRYQLWDIRLIINRTAVYGALTAVVILLYILVVGALGVLFRSSGNWLLGIVATGLIAILFDPLRRWLQRHVNRLMYGQRDEPLPLLTRFGGRLEQAADPETILLTAVQTIAQSLKLPYTAISLNQDGQPQIAASFPPHTLSPAHLLTLPLVYQSQPIGHLLVGYRDGEAALSQREMTLLTEIARQTAVAAHTVRLHRELRQTRQQLVTAQAEERRRVSRALGDSLGAQLATLLIQTDTTRQALQTDADTAVSHIQSLKTGTQTAVQTVRSLVQSLANQ